jgi:membrane protease YdiL (CAAX protease family)
MGLAQTLQNFRRTAYYERSQASHLRDAVIVFAVLIATWELVQPFHTAIQFSGAGVYYLYAVLAAPALIATEYAAGWLILRARGIRATGMTVNQDWQRPSGAVILFTLLVALMEEIVFRGLWRIVFLDNLGVTVMLFVGISALIYGCNHLYYGPVTVLQKTISGAGYGILFVLSGFNLLIPITAHLLQNILILFMGNIGNIRMRRTHQQARKQTQHLTHEPTNQPIQSSAQSAGGVH